MRITDLEKTIGTFHMEVDDLYIEPEKIHGIVGPNGCGKTVFLKIAAGILPPDTGTVDYDGLSPRDITMMFQRPYLMHTTVYENLIYPLKIRGIRPDEEEIDRMLSRVGLKEQKRQYARSLSSGERQKLSFLRAVIFKPRMIMVDETLSNLDSESEELFAGMIGEIQKVRPVTWLIVNHQMDHICRLCDEMHYMEKGRFVKR
ncbi:ATP-binding cassette domain-containing protein [Dorea sp. D27]|uniref:ATP-binding cassette domain-containing protein n=1 Tax=Dorea sp. D27 TaxID=658665 RepID=UPI0006732E7D|nr:ATP-binding cassette domain-containing protein [Dorea sp. D27]